MGYIRKIVLAGDVLEISEYYEAKPCNSLGGHGQKIKDNAAEYEKRQQEQREKHYREKLIKLSRLINSNFTEGDLSLSLTFRKSISIAESKNDLVNYIRVLKRRRKKQGLSDLKYIAVTEYGSGGKNKHHHVIINKMSLDDVAKAWKHGKVIISPLEPMSDYSGLARYITKEPKRKHEKQIRHSHNLQQPIIKLLPAVPDRADLRLPQELQDKFYIVDTSKRLGVQFGCRKYLKAIAKGGHDWGLGDELLK